jgi:non-specific serine/threonine protein kinase/serine/threonine-protein kinase
MGIVHLAEQEHPIRRQVALKVIKPGMDTKRVIAHFEAERQVMAFFDHPNIAHIHDAGVTQQGYPFFVMEYIDGLPITDYCDQQKLSIEARLLLFLDVCDAVHHAHQKGVIHRDIKPSNVLVSRQDGKPVPKIIDFGVAKAIGPSLIEYTLHTEVCQLLGTPEYMSPEQADMVGADIDIRSDVYSLGVLLYVLLAGSLPFDTQNLRGHGIEHIRKIIREKDPEKPASRLLSLDGAGLGQKIALDRQTDVKLLYKRLRNELEWIPLMAMRKDSSRRYQSIAELAQDIRNYLNGNLLSAGPLSSTYRFSKFIRRNKTWIITSVLLMVVLISGTLISTLFAIQAKKQAKNAQTLYTFFNESLLDSLNPLTSNADEVTAAWILNRASNNLQDQFEGEPLIEASIHQTLANAYRELGVLESAQVHQDFALSRRRKFLGDRHPDTLDSMYASAVLCREQSRYAEAVQLSKQTLATQKRVLGSGDTRTLLTMKILAQSYQDQGNLNEAVALLLEAERIAERVLGQEHKYTLFIKVSLAGVFRSQGEFTKAETILEGTLPTYKRLWGEWHPYTLDLMRVLGMLYSRHKNPKDAEPIFRKELEIRRRVLGEEHLQTLSSMSLLAELYTQQDRYPEANDLAAKALDIGLRKYGEDHPTTLWSGIHLAVLRMAQKEFDEAETLLIRVIEGWTRISDDGHQNTLWAKLILSRVYMAQNRYNEATPLLLEAFEGLLDKLGPEHPDTLESANDLGVLYKQLERFDEALNLLTRAWEGRTVRLGNDHPDTLASLNNIISLYEAWGKPDEASQWREKIPHWED